MDGLVLVIIVLFLNDFVFSSLAICYYSVDIEMKDNSHKPFNSIAISPIKT